MPKLWFVAALLLCSASLSRGQVLVGRHVLAGTGNDQPTVVAADSQGFVYVAGNTTSGDFPVSNALESQAPQGGLEVSVNGAPFVNSGLLASTGANVNNLGVTAVAASSDGMLVIVSAANGTYRSTDGGVTWKPTAGTLPPAAALAVDPVNPSNAYALLESGVLYRSSNGGVNWQTAAATPPNTAPLGPPSSSQPLSGRMSITIDPRNSDTLYVCGDYAIYRSTDGAQSWQLLSIPVTNGQFPVTAFALAPSQPNVLYAADGTNFTSFAAGPLLTSTDGGTTWTAYASDVMPSSATAMAVDPTNASTVWVAGTNGTVQKSTDGGATFQTVATFGSLMAYSIAIDPANPLRVYVTSSSGIFETADGGATWSTAFLGYAYGTVLYAAPSRTYEFGGPVPATVFLTKLNPALSQVIYSTYLWTGSVTGIAVDGQRNVVLTGTGGDGGIVMKVRADDSSLLYSTVLTGAQPNAIAIDSGGNAVIAGNATTLAATKGAYQSGPPGPCTPNPNTGPPPSQSWNAFAAKLNANGALVYATYITGSCGSSGYGLALDPAGDAYVAGETYSPDFPVTQNAMTGKFPGNYSSGFVAELSAAGDQLLYSSFFGGGNFTAAHAVTLDAAGNIYLAGSTEASPTAGATQALAASPGECGPPPGFFPPAGNDAFVLKMTPSAAPAAFLATLGGSCQGEVDSIALDAAGDIWLAGYNGSFNFLTWAPIGGLESMALASTQTSGFVAELNPTGSTLLSATLTDYHSVAVAADSTAVYYAGPLGTAALVAEIDPTQVAPIVLGEIVQDSPLVPAASRLPSPVAPGEIVRLLGRGIGPQNQVITKLTAAGTLATSTGGVQVTFNGVPAPLVTVQASQIECIAPFELDGLDSAVVQVQYNGQKSNAYIVDVVPQNPDVLAVVNSDWSVNSESNPARQGSQVTIFLTGLGQTIPAGNDGAINRPPLAQLETTPTIAFQYAPANVTFLGAAAFEVAGVSQVNMILPVGAASPFPVYFGNGGPAASVYIVQ